LSDIPHARPSSTVVLVRAGTGEPELFMVRRHVNLSFGSAYAFPGGVVDPEDKDVHAYCRGVTAREADARLGTKGEGLDYYSAAIRELFEETGVLLSDVDRVVEGPDAARDALNDGCDNWADFVKRNKLRLECGELHYFAHWITPPTQVRRYSTRFFIAALPDGQRASHCGGELTRSCWATANETLQAGRDGRAKLHFPTIKSLESIARHKTFEALIEWAASCVAWGVTTMAPMVIERHGRKEVALPGDKDYPGYDS
jgi:8-oxo-dGTP pyrophosphatase MutT (NUDIX family)